MNDVLLEVESRVDNNFNDEKQQTLKMDIHNKIPDLMQDNTDRNRTSPFAFTGNKFEVRAVGSSANCSSTMTVMNTIMAQQLREFKKETDLLIKSGEGRDSAILQVLKKYITASKRILFEGNNYSVEWEKEAAKRGLQNIKTTPLALDAIISKKAVDLFTANSVFTEAELHARHEIQLEDYIKKVQIEGRMLGELAMTHIIPAAMDYQTSLLGNIAAAEAVGLKKNATDAQKKLASEIGERINKIVELTIDHYLNLGLINNIQ